MRSFKVLVAIIFLLFNLMALRCESQELYHELYRPQLHFSPREKWINDPNGMVFYKGVYHLFFQYYPNSTVWGPMHWGHATSTDLIHWQQQPIALYPDSLGYIFSGSAVVDSHNTSGLGQNGTPPLIAIFTSHNVIGERQHLNNYENQSLAYSLDDGKSWVKYAGNPVLKNPGITDFRDPKVMWFAPGKKWVMTLATKDRVTFFSSRDLIHWSKESDFGNLLGAHGGVWECPDLFPLNDRGKQVWVLVVNVNPGGPNQGSATQYFTGTFNGNQFTNNSSKIKWLDYGPDEYAGVTWSNTGGRKIFLGWMSNWMYANLVPSQNWRNAMTLPRELSIRHVGKEMYVASEPVKELAEIESSPVAMANVTVAKSVDLAKLIKRAVKVPFRMNMIASPDEDFSLRLSNDSGENTEIGFVKASNQYFIDRTHSGKVNFQNEFAARHTMPRLSEHPTMNLSIIVDESSVELFADDGLSVMTSIFFPSTPYNHVEIQTQQASAMFKKIQYITMKSIW